MQEPDSHMAHEVEQVWALATQVVGSFYESLKQSPYIEWEAMEGVIEKDGTWVDSIAAHCSFHDYVYLFLSGFPRVTAEDARTLAVGAQLVAEHAILLDKLVDAQLGHARPFILASYLSCHYRLQQASRAFQELFDASSDFWLRFDAFWLEQAGVMVAERTRHDGQVIPYTGEELWRSATGKQACAKLVPTALGLLGHEPDKIEPLTASQDHHAMGLQLHDDLCDWKFDYERGNYSYILTRTLIESGLANQIMGDEKPDAELVGKFLYFSGLAEEALGESIAAFDHAHELAAEQGCPGWLGYVQRARTRSANLQQDLELLRATTKERARIEAEPLPRPASDEVTTERAREATESALRLLVQEQQRGFVEARHPVFFPQPEPLAKGGHLRTGDVFARALILEALAHCRRVGLMVPDEVLQAEVDYLARSRLEGPQRGWTYIPGVSGLPADADTLGAVLSALASAAPERMAELCGDVVALLAEHNVRSNGAVDTWLADPDDEDALRAKARMYEAWGEEPDLDVVANALFGVCLYDKQAFGDVLRAGVSYLASVQHSDGSWSGHWYWGRTYPTWLCCRLLADVEPDCEPLARGLQYVLQAQHQDGGWGEPESTPLETAFGVLACDLQEGQPELDTAGRRGLSYLLGRQRSSGAWPASPFVKVDLSRLRLERQATTSAHVLTFKSATVTTAFCLRALLTALQES